MEELSVPEGEDVTEAEDTDALGVSRGVPAVGDTVNDDTGVTAGADGIGALPVSVDISVGLGATVAVAVVLGVAVSRGVPPVGDTVEDDTDATPGADDIGTLPVSVGMSVGLGATVAVAVSRGVVETVIDDTGATEGAPVTTDLGVTTDHTSRHPQLYRQQCLVENKSSPMLHSCRRCHNHSMYNSCMKLC